MTREEQIYSQSISYTRNIFGKIEDFSDVIDAFADGVRWADENPQFSKEEFIDKACDWLRKNTTWECNFYGGTNPNKNKIEEFRKAMEG